MNEFLKELTELTRKHNITLHGSGVYYGFAFDKIEDAGNGFYQVTLENENCIEWIHKL